MFCSMENLIQKCLLRHLTKKNFLFFYFLKNFYILIVCWFLLIYFFIFIFNFYILILFLLLVYFIWLKLLLVTFAPRLCVFLFCAICFYLLLYVSSNMYLFSIFPLPFYSFKVVASFVASVMERPCYFETFSVFRIFNIVFLYCVLDKFYYDILLNIQIFLCREIYIKNVYTHWLWTNFHEILKDQQSNYIVTLTIIIVNCQIVKKLCLLKKTSVVCKIR